MFAAINDTPEEEWQVAADDGVLSAEAQESRLVNRCVRQTPAFA